MFRRDAVLGNVAVHLLVLRAQGVLLAPFLGIVVLPWSFCRPIYPVSVMASVSGWSRTPESLNSRKSWRRPASWARQRILPVALSTTRCVFRVWRFFLPE